jgi:hypothetical protein
LPIDPFRIQFLTVTLDSQVVLAVVGLVVAGLVVGRAAPRVGLPDIGAGAWWDVAAAALIGARMLWVAAHLDYYVRGPLQALVLTDGGLHPVGLVLGAAYGVWRLVKERGEPRPWRPALELLALGVLAFFLFERAGCALTTCGSGPPADVAWALRRGDELRQPLALYQVGVLAISLWLVAEVPAVARRAVPVALTALAVIEVIGLILGGRALDGVVAVLLAGALATAALSPAARRRAAGCGRAHPLLRRP